MTHSSKMTLSAQVRSYVLSKITGKQWNKGDKIPKDQDLASELGISYQTVRGVVSQLAKDGYLQRYQGKGTFVAHDLPLHGELNEKRRILFVHTSGDFNNLFARLVTQQAVDQGFEVLEQLVCSCQDAIETFNHFDRDRYDAVLFLPPGGQVNAELLMFQKTARVPFIFLDCDLTAVQCNSVMTDSRKGGELAAKHLLALGHQKIAVVIGEPADTSQVRDRVQGFIGLLEILGIKPVIIDCHAEVICDRTALACQIIEQKLKDGLEVTAIYAVSDATAIGVMHALQKENIEVPRQVSVIGFDGLPLGEFINPPLTSVYQPLKEVARVSIQMLGQMFDGSDSCVKNIFVLPEMVVRKSTDVCIGYKPGQQVSHQMTPNLSINVRPKMVVTQ